MKKILLLAVSVLIFHVGTQAQKSPKKSATGTIDGVNVSIVYHSPFKKGRDIMGGLVPYGEVWRTGANDATTIKFSEDVKIEGESLSAGTYSLFTIPGEEEWVIIFNNTVKQWGAFNYSEDDDALRVSVEPGSVDETVESFTISVEEDGVRLAWENTSVKFGVSN